MKMKKILSAMLVILVTLGATALSGKVVKAADTVSNVTSGLSTANPGRIQVKIGAGRSTLESNYPTVTVKANNLSAFGSGQRITTKTTRINVTINGNLVDKDGDKITSYYADLLDKNGDSITKPTDAVTVSPSTTVNMSVDHTFDVDLSKLKDDAPIYIAFCFKTSYDPDYVNLYSTIKIVVSTLTPTITTSPITTATTTIKGTGTNVGDTITNNVTGDTTTVGSDKTYTLTLSADALKDKTSIEVSESNDFGDSGTTTADVTNPLTIDADKTSLDLSSADVTKLEAMSDSDFVDWVKTQANIVGKDSSGSSDGISIKTDTTDLAAALKKVDDNGSMSIDFYATDGTNKSSTKTITLVKPGTVKFGDVSDSINFGTHGVPTATTVFGPTTAWNVNINDTRASGSKWYLYANATKMTSGTHTMPGYMMYRDANGQTSDLTQSTLIDSGARGTDAKTDVTTNWTTDPKDTSKAGIFLDVEPGVYADSSIDYAGTVNWSLMDTPTQ